MPILDLGLYSGVAYESWLTLVARLFSRMASPGQLVNVPRALGLPGRLIRYGGRVVCRSSQPRV